MSLLSRVKCRLGRMTGNPLLHSPSLMAIGLCPCQRRPVPVFQTRKRKSHVAGAWGFSWLHANEWGGSVLKGRAGLRTVNGFIVRMPRRYVTVVFRRRELKL